MRSVTQVSHFDNQYPPLALEPVAFPLLPICSWTMPVTYELDFFLEVSRHVKSLFSLPLPLCYCTHPEHFFSSTPGQNSLRMVWILSDELPCLLNSPTHSVYTYHWKHVTKIHLGQSIVKYRLVGWSFKVILRSKLGQMTNLWPRLDQVFLVKVLSVFSDIENSEKNFEQNRS